MNTLGCKRHFGNAQLETKVLKVTQAYSGRSGDESEPEPIFCARFYLRQRCSKLHQRRQ